MGPERAADDGTSGPWRVFMLGGFRVSYERTPVHVAQNLQRLVAYTALEGGWVSRAQVAAALWPDVCEPRAASNLRTGLWRLGRVAPLLIAERSSVSVAPRVEVDIHRLSAAAERIFDGDVDAVTETRAFWGQLLPRWEEEWVTIERERIRQLELHVLDAAALVCLDSGRYGDSVDFAHRAIELEPLRESSHRILIQAYLAGGNRAAALEHFRHLTSTLLRELGLPPEDATRELVTSLFPRGTQRSVLAQPP